MATLKEICDDFSILDDSKFIAVQGKGERDEIIICVEDLRVLGEMLDGKTLDGRAILMGNDALSKGVARLPSGYKIPATELEEYIDHLREVGLVKGAQGSKPSKAYAGSFVLTDFAKEAGYWQKEDSCDRY